MQPSFEDLRRDVAALLRERPEAIDPDENLIDLGLDSLRLMKLFLALEAAGLAVDYPMFLESPTLSGIWAAAGQALPDQAGSRQGTGGGAA